MVTHVGEDDESLEGEHPLALRHMKRQRQPEQKRHDDDTEAHQPVQPGLQFIHSVSL